VSSDIPRSHRGENEQDEQPVLRPRAQETEVERVHQFRLRRVSEPQAVERGQGHGLRRETTQVGREAAWNTADITQKRVLLGGAIPEQRTESRVLGQGRDVWPDSCHRESGVGDLPSGKKR